MPQGGAALMCRPARSQEELWASSSGPGRRLGATAGDQQTESAAAHAAPRGGERGESPSAGQAAHIVGFNGTLRPYRVP